MMRFLETRIPPLILVLVYGTGMYGIERLNLTHFDFGVFGGVAATILLAIGLLFCILAATAFRWAKTTMNPVDPNGTSALVTGGIFRISRNPMYVAFLFFLLAWGLYLSDLLALAFGLLFIPYMTAFQIAPEERALHSLFGAKYENYCTRVRRWL